jgi:hypothetical protein
MSSNNTSHNNNNNNALASSINGRPIPIPSPTRMVIGGIPSNTSYKSKNVGGAHGGDDDEQESFFIHPKNQGQFKESVISNGQNANKLFGGNEGGSDKDGE